VDVELVNILFNARDKKGGLVGDLNKDDIEIYEDGKLQEIRAFSRDANLPLTIGLLVDVSKSQESLIEVERRAAAAFFREVLRDRDMAFLISFGSEAELLQDLTSSPRILTQALQQLRVNVDVGAYAPGPVPSSRPPRGTILFDAVYLAATDKLAGEVGRKIIVVITDGIDQGSRVKVAEAIAAAHRADAIVYSIYYVDYRAYGYTSFGVSDSDLRKMSDDTGGRVFKVDERKMPLQAVFDQIQQEMRTQYSVGYATSNPKRDGAFRKIEIRPKNKDMKIQARRGYFAPRG
jgi:VWFA-related protein